MVRNTMIPVVLVAAHDSPYTCIALLVALHIFSLVVLVIYRPYERKAINYLEALNTALLSVILLIIMYIYSQLNNDGPEVS